MGRTLNTLLAGLLVIGLSGCLGDFSYKEPVKTTLLRYRNKPVFELTFENNGDTTRYGCSFRDSTLAYVGIKPKGKDEVEFTSGEEFEKAKKNIEKYFEGEKNKYPGAL